MWQGKPSPAMHSCPDPDCPLADAPLLSPRRLLYGLRWWLHFVIWHDEPKYSLLWHLRFYQRRHARDRWKRIHSSQGDVSMHPSLLTSSDHLTVTIDPAPEPAATYDVVERALIAAGLSAMILHDDDVPPPLRLRYASLLEQSKRECQCVAIRLARETARESEREA